MRDNNDIPCKHRHQVCHGRDPGQAEGTRIVPHSSAIISALFRRVHHIESTQAKFETLASLASQPSQGKHDRRVWGPGQVQRNGYGGTLTHVRFWPFPVTEAGKVSLLTSGKRGKFCNQVRSGSAHRLVGCSQSGS